MNFKEIIKRAFPFVAAVFVGLLITSIFMPIGPDLGRYKERRSNRYLKMENNRLFLENQKLRYANERLMRGESVDAVPYAHSSERCKKRHRKGKRVRSLSVDVVE